MTLEELKIESLQCDLAELNEFVSENRNEIKLLFSNLVVGASVTRDCIELIRHIHSKRRNGIDTVGIQSFVTSLAFYFKSANNTAFVQTCITNLQDNVLKYRLQAWFQYKFEYRQTNSHLTRFSQYLEKISKAIADENEDYTDDVLSDLDSYFFEFSHIAGFQELFDSPDLLNKFPILSEYKKRKGALDYRIELHENEDKIFTPSLFTEKLFTEKFIDYIKFHESTVWNNILLGLDTFTIRSEVINFGQANFDKPYKKLTPAEIVKLYCYFNMRKHYYSSLYLFERCSWIKKLISKDGCLKFVDVGCGPATSGIALTDYLLSIKNLKQQFDYIGVDYYDSMLTAAADFMTNSVYRKCTNNDFIKSIAEIKDDNFSNANSILLNTCYLFASPTLKIDLLATEINNLLNDYSSLPRFLLFQNTTDEAKNIKYELFKKKLLKHDVLLSEKVTIKYNNQRNSFYPPVHESIYFEVLKF
ncbi:MAG TPA: hypothetical protein PLJ42_10525 [Chitinophagales bacterium]|nr:hypothetical protein [Chitinophagales bacterium]HQW79857.1 hypothetical protein [Chitinophagales bacterium]